jgi:serine/threonine protein kinase
VRAVVWAFGCVLFEMLTAKRAFEGDLLLANQATERMRSDRSPIPLFSPLVYFENGIMTSLQTSRSGR